MKVFLLISFVMFTIYSGFCQVEKLYLGKRKNVFWDRKVSQSNLGSIYTYYYPIFFKTSLNKKYAKTGLFGKNIGPHLNLDIPLVASEFKNYKANKKWSYVLLGATITSLSAWIYTSAKYMDRTGDYRILAFFRPQSLSLLGGYFVCFYSSIYLNLNGDKHLKKAVYVHNKSG